jgi:hypothetical protein
VDGWRVRAQYVFIAEAPSIDEVDRIAGGEAHHMSGGIRSSYAGDAERTHLEWAYADLAQAAAAARRLGEAPAVDRISVAPTPEWRAQNPEELQITRAQARGRGVRCPSCRTRIGGEELTYALEGRPPGSESIVTCAQCGLAVAWMVAPED